MNELVCAFLILKCFVLHTYLAPVHDRCIICAVNEHISVCKQHYMRCISRFPGIAMDPCRCFDVSWSSLPQIMSFHQLFWMQCPIEFLSIKGGVYECNIVTLESVVTFTWDICQQQGIKQTPVPHRCFSYQWSKGNEWPWAVCTTSNMSVGRKFHL